MKGYLTGVALSTILSTLLSPSPFIDDMRGWPSTINSCAPIETLLPKTSLSEILLDPTLEGDERSNPCCYNIVISRCWIVK